LPARSRSAGGAGPGRPVASPVQVGWRRRSRSVRCLPGPGRLAAPAQAGPVPPARCRPAAACEVRAGLVPPRQYPASPVPGACAAAGIIVSDEQTAPPLSGDHHATSRRTLRDLPAHRGPPSWPGQSDANRALPPGTSGGTRPGAASRRGRSRAVRRLGGRVTPGRCPGCCSGGQRRAGFHDRRWRPQAVTSLVEKLAHAAPRNTTT
jgi:hypothetical protein